MLYEETTSGITVQVRPIYNHSESSSRNNVYVWSYDVEITNHTSDVVQLLHRYWKIVDEDGNAQEVRGPGVIGQRPIIGAGEKHSYSSFTHLPTPTGHMEGHYEMITTDGYRFHVMIPRFDLHLPVRLVHSQNELTL